MRLCSIASGSSGNCIYVGSDATNLLIDTGISGKKVEFGLNSLDLTTKDLNGIFVTHEHSDHIKGVGVFSRRYRLPVFANEKTWHAMAHRLGKIAPRHQQVFRNEEVFVFQDLEVLPFSTYHDAADPVGYRFVSEGQQVSILTDTGQLDARMVDAIRGSDVYYLEANHDPILLQEGPYPQVLKQRIRSAYGHLSNQQAAEVLCEVLEGRGEAVLLAHLSEENNTPQLCRSTIVGLLAQEGLDVQRDQRILVCSRFSPSPWQACLPKEAHPAVWAAAEAGR